MPQTDREQIVELMAIYADALDTKDYEGIAACFGEDATAEYAGFAEPLAGRDAILAHMRRALDPLAASQHMFANFIVRIDGHTAKLKCDILAQHVCRNEAGSDVYMAGGKYTVLLRRTAAGWQFQAIEARSTWGLGSRDMLPRTEHSD